MPQGDTNMPTPKSADTVLKAKPPEGAKEFNLQELLVVLAHAHDSGFDPLSTVKIVSNFRSGIREVMVTSKIPLRPPTKRLTYEEPNHG